MKRLLAVLILTTLSATSVLADGKTKALFRKCAPATVSIECKPDEKGMAKIGCGSIIDAGGLVLTNNHVIAGALTDDKRVTVYLFDGRHFVGEIVANSAEIDLAIIRLIDSPGGLPILEWGDSDAIEVGEDVIAIGNPDGLAWTLSSGIISGKRDDWVQTTAPINPGNSGGPLIGPDGKMIGVNTLSKYEDRNNIAFSRSQKVSQAWVNKMLAADAAIAAAPRYTDEARGFSFAPPDGWSRLDDNAENTYQHVAYAGDGAVLRVYLIPGKPSTIRDQLAVQEKVLSDQLPTYHKVQAEILTFRGGEGAYALTYTFKEGEAVYVSHQISVNEDGASWVLRFTISSDRFDACKPQFDDVLYGARWPGAESGRETPEKALEGWVQAIRTGDLDAFMTSINLPLYLDFTSDGGYSKLNDAQRAQAEKDFAARISEMIADGSLQKQIEKGVRFLSATIDGDRAVVPLVSVAPNDQTIVEDVTLQKGARGWQIVGNAPARPFEEQGGGTGQKEFKRKKFRDDAKAYSVQVPEEWATAKTDNAENVVTTTFSEKDASGSPKTVLIITTGDLRKDLAQDTLTEADLEELTNQVVGGAKGTFKGGWEQGELEATTLGGLDSRTIRYTARTDDLSPELECTLTVSYKNGWLYAVTIMTQKGEPVPAEYGRIVDSFKATGKRKKE